MPVVVASRESLRILTLIILLNLASHQPHTTHKQHIKHKCHSFPYPLSPSLPFPSNSMAQSKTKRENSSTPQLRAENNHKSTLPSTSTPMEATTNTINITNTTATKSTTSYSSSPSSYSSLSSSKRKTFLSNQTSSSSRQIPSSRNPKTGHPPSASIQQTVHRNGNDTSTSPSISHIPPLQSQLSLVQEAKTQLLQPSSTSQTWFLISAPWFRQWEDTCSCTSPTRTQKVAVKSKKMPPTTNVSTSSANSKISTAATFSSQSSTTPSSFHSQHSFSTHNLSFNDLSPLQPIDNLHFLVPHTTVISDSQQMTPFLQVSKDAQYQRDYLIFNQKVWELLHLWYGGGPVVPRSVYKLGSEFKVEIYPLTLNVTFLDSNKDYLKLVNQKHTYFHTPNTSASSSSQSQQVAQLHGVTKNWSRHDLLTRACAALNKTISSYTSPSSNTSAKTSTTTDPALALTSYKLYSYIDQNNIDIIMEDTVLEMSLAPNQWILIEPVAFTPNTITKNINTNTKKNKNGSFLSSKPPPPPPPSGPPSPSPPTSPQILPFGDGLAGDENYDVQQITSFMDFTTEMQQKASHFEAKQAQVQLRNARSERNTILSKTLPIKDVLNANPDSGKIGLINLGNTCFMNSALQCLSNTAVLTDYFLTGAFNQDINESNPLGMNGHLATEYAKLLQNLWPTSPSSTSSSYAPRQFKLKISQYAPQFSGYQQQDSHELLAFLLDGIHEDLNRIRTKPYTQAVEGDGKEADAVVAKKAWKTHKLRHDSIIVDLFQGLYKSTVICPSCQKISITFDPYMYLSLPLPPERKSISVIFVPKPSSRNSRLSQRPTKFLITLSLKPTVLELKKALSTLTNVPHTKLLVGEILFHKLTGFPWEDSKSLETINNNSFTTIIAYQVDHEVTSNTMNNISISDETPVIVQMIQSSDVQEHVSFPHVFTILPKNASHSTLFENALLRVLRFCDFEKAHSLLDHNSPLRKNEKEFYESFFKATLRPGMLISIPALESDDGVVIDRDGKDIVPLDPNHVVYTLNIHWNNDNNFYSRFFEFEKSLLMNHDLHNSAMTETNSMSYPLEECLRLWGEKEVLTEDNAWYCSQCKEHKCASKHLKLWSVPDILVVHLKRFSYTSWSRNKLETPIDFPLECFDITKFVTGAGQSSEPLIYDLYAVSNHIGGLGGGHYTAYAKAPRQNSMSSKGNWFDYDDSYVSKITNLSKIRSPLAYVLFYVRQGSLASTYY